MAHLRLRNWFPSTPWRRTLALLIAGMCGASVLLAQTGGDAPVPIQRIVLPPERVAKELERVQQGGLLLLPLAELDARLERVRRTMRARAEKPRLTRAHYSAELIDRSLQGGSGAWTVHHAGGGLAILPVDPLNLALAKLRWKQGGDAILGELDGKALGLVVGPGGAPGAQTCLFDWSARGTPANEGITFSLATPACPISTFDLTLPVDHFLSVPQGAAVTGPHTAAAADKRVWKVQSTGPKPLEIAVRKIAQSKGPGMALFARVQATEQLAPDRIEVKHEFQVDILHGSVRELFLDGDAALQPYDVFLKSGEIKTWQWSGAQKDPKGKLPAVAAGLAGVLRIEFHQPVQGKLQGLRVKSLVARPAAAVWSSPVLRVRGALSRGETLEVQVHPDLPQGQWDLGSFQPVHSATEPGGKQILTLAQTAPDAASARRPTLLAPAKNIELRTSEHYEWRLTPRAADLKADIQYAPSRGNLFELTIKLPSAGNGYSIEALELQPAELLRGWHLNGDFLVVELKLALTAAKKANLKIHLRANYRELVSGSRMHGYPEVVPTDSGKREGTLAVFVDPKLNALLLNSTVPLVAEEEAGRDKRSAAPSFRFDFRDQKLGATIRVTPQPVLVEWRGKHAVSLAKPRALLQFRWEAEPIVGAPETLDFRFAPGFPSAWRIKTEEGALGVHHWERLHLPEALPHVLQLGSQHGLHAAVLETMLPAGSQWRLFLSEPLAKKTHLTIEAEMPAGLLEAEARQLSLFMPRADAWAWLGGALTVEAMPKSTGARVWSIPLAAPLQSAHVEQEIAVDSPFEPIHQATADGSLVVRPNAAAAEKTPFHVQLHQASSGPFAHAANIHLWTRPEKRATSLLERCDDAKITAYVRKDGAVYHRVQFHLWHWRDPTFAMRFEPSVQIVAVKLHDRWLEGLDVRAESTGVRLTLPFDQNTPFVRYEIYARSQSGGLFLPAGMKVQMPSIDWPIAPIDLRTRVCLENGWTPLVQENLAPIGVPARIARQSATLRSLRQAWNWGQVWWPYGETAQLADKLAEQKKTVLLAERQLHGKGETKPIKLAAALERFAATHLKDAAPLVIDQIALRSLGLSGETMLGPADLTPQARRPFWEKLGLIHVPCPKGALLTSPRRMQLLGIHGAVQAAELDGAMEEAILHGRDASAGFYLILTWLKLPAAEPQASSSTSVFPIAEDLGEFQEMTEWQLDPARTGYFYLIDSTVGPMVGWLLAALAGLVMWRLHGATTAVVGFRANALLLTAGSVALLWLPGVVGEFFVLPAVLMMAASLIVSLIRLAVSRTGAGASGHSTISKPAASAAGLGVLALGIAWGAVAQPPADRVYPVFIIDGKAPSALVTPDLIAKLVELENQPDLDTRGAVLLRGQYTGIVRDALATFDVEYAFHSFMDQANLVIPLTGVQLQEGSRLDGTPVFPTVHKAGYVLPIKSKGPHHLRFSFTVRISSASDHADLKFTIPKLVQNEMSLEWSAPVQAVHCKHGWGEEHTAEDGGKFVKSWRGRLGYEKDVHLHWTTQAGPPAPKTIAVSEAHFWDLRPAAPALWTSLHYAVGTGTLGQCSVALPEGLHVRGVEAVTIPATPAPPVASSIAIKHWQIVGKGGQRRVQIDLAQPATGNFVLNLEMVPQFLAREKQFLPLPAPLQGKSIFGLLGYRLDAAELEVRRQNLTVQSITPAEFKQLWKKHHGPEAAQASHAYSFQRTSQQAAGLELILQPNARQVQLQLQWDVEFYHADLLGKFTITSAQDDLMFLEFAIDPTLTLANVAGPDVQSWQMQASVLQVWLRQPRKRTTVEITGWRSLPYKGGLPAQQIVALPSVFLVKTPITEGTLGVRPAPGLLVEPATLKLVRPRPAEPNGYFIDGAAYEASFTLRPDSRPPPALVLTKIHGTQAKIEIRHSVRLTTSHGRLPILKLHLKDGPNEPFTLEAPGATVTPIKDKTLKHPAWTITYPPGLPQEVYLTLRGRIGMEKLASVPLCSVELEGAAVENTWLAWKDVEILHADTGKKLASQKKVKDRIALIGNESWSRDMASWSGADMPRSVKAALPKTPARSNVRVLTRAEAAHWTDGHWLREASFWLLVPEAAELRVKFPAPVEQFRALADQRSQSTWNPSAQEFVLPMDASPEPRFVELRWKYTADVESAEKPNIGALRIDQTVLPAPQRLVTIPPGFASANVKAQSDATLLERLLHEAETHMLLAAALAQDPVQSDDNVKAIFARQQQFYAYVRQAEYALSSVKSIVGDFDAQGWLESLNDLKSKNAGLAKERRYDDQRKAAEKVKKLVLAAAPREDFALLGIPMLLPPSLPRLAFESADARRFAEQRTRTEWILLATVFFLLLSYFRHGLSITRWLIPELAIGLCILGLFIYGVSLIGAIALGLLVLTRVFWIARAVKSRFAAAPVRQQTDGQPSTQSLPPVPPPG